MGSDDLPPVAPPSGREAFLAAPIGETPLSLQQRLLASPDSPASAPDPASVAAAASDPAAASAPAPAFAASLARAEAPAASAPDPAPAQAPAQAPAITAGQAPAGPVLVEAPAFGATLQGDPATVARVREKLLSEARAVAGNLTRDHALHDWPWRDAQQVLSGRFPLTYVAAPDPAAPPIPTIVGGDLLRFHGDPRAMAQLDELALLLDLARWAGASDAEVAAMVDTFREPLVERRHDAAEGRR